MCNNDTPLLVLRDIRKSFGDVCVLDGASLRLERGKVYTLCGDNGSGKTTLFHIISGFLAPDTGLVEFRGRSIIGVSPAKINHLGIARTFQDLRLARQMTVAENVLLVLEKNIFSRPSPSQHKRVDEILEKTFLAEKRDTLAGEISYGQQKLLTFACCLAGDVALLLLAACRALSEAAAA